MLDYNQSRREYMLCMLNDVHPHLYEYEVLAKWVDLRNEVENRVYLDCDDMDTRIRQFLDIYMPFSPDPEPYVQPTEELNPLHLI